MSNWKLVSPAKVAANQANAQLSTGPKTDEGKARSAQNTLKHGLSSGEVFVKPEEIDTFHQFRQDYVDELRPAGPLEHELAAAVIHAA